MDSGQIKNDKQEECGLWTNKNNDEQEERGLWSNKKIMIYRRKIKGTWTLDK